MERDKRRRGASEPMSEDVGVLLRALSRPKAPPELYNKVMDRIAADRTRATAMWAAGADGRRHRGRRLVEDAAAPWVAMGLGAALAGLCSWFVLVRNGLSTGQWGQLQHPMETAAAAVGRVAARGVQWIAAVTPSGWAPVVAGLGWGLLGWAAAALVVATIDSLPGATTE